MSTIYTFHVEPPALTANGLASDDQWLCYDTSAGTTKRCTTLDIQNWVSGNTAVAMGTSLTGVEATHRGKLMVHDDAAGSTFVLPTSTATGAVYKTLVTITATSNSHIVKVTASTTDEFRGYCISDSDTATAPNIWWAADNDDTYTANRSTSGLAAQGEYGEYVDAVLHHFFCRIYNQQSGTEVTPFSATVA